MSGSGEKDFHVKKINCTNNITYYYRDKMVVTVFTVIIIGFAIIAQP